MQHCIRASLPYKNRTKLQKKHGKKTPKNNTDRNRRTIGMLTQFARTELLLGKEAMEKVIALEKEYLAKNHGSDWLKQ